MLYQPENTPVAISYPTPDSLAVLIPTNINSNIIYINESFDNGWKAIFQNKIVPLKPVGPNFIAVTLPENFKKGRRTLS